MLASHSTSPSDVVGDLGRPLRVVRSTDSCAVVAEEFRADDELACVAVREPGSGRTGIVTRETFLATMAGRFGYGWSLHARGEVGDLTDWHPLILASATNLAEAARAILARRRAQRFTEVLLAGSESSEMLRLPVEDVFASLATSMTTKAMTDHLTGLPNREHFMERLAAVAASVSQRPRALVLAYVDLDDFKTINDSFGHAVGDDALRTTAQRLLGCVRSEDVVARLGGDEFALLLDCDDANGADGPAAAAAEALGARLTDVLRRPMRLGDRLLPGRASIGIAVSTPSRADVSTLLHEADLAMYRAKATGGGRVELVTDVEAITDPVLAPDRLELSRAVARGEFVVHFQPVIDVVTGELATLEALVRWNHPTRGLLPPARFLDAVGAADFAVDLDAFVLRAAVSQLAVWRAELGAAAPPRVNVNLSVPGLLREDLVESVLAVLEELAVPPHALRLELPELATATHLRTARLRLDELRRRGVGLTLDDLGTGAAGLGHLSQLRLDGLKIDRRFVANMLIDERDAAVVRMLVETAHQLNMNVTAEGVEEEGHLVALRAMARRRPVYVQGYVISRPVPAEELSLPWRPCATPAPSLERRRH